MRGRPVVLRIGLGVLAAIDAWVGGWALFFPASFYADFPGMGMHWVTATPPYNQHFLTDFGAALLGIAAVLCLAAVITERRVVQLALLAALVQAVPHLIFHLSHPESLRGVGGPPALSTSALALPVVLALALLWLTRRPERATAASDATR